MRRADRLPRLFPFFGSKWRLAPKYPAPTHDTIVEPFCGSAGYSCLYPDRRIMLYDADPVVACVWSFLIRSSERDIMALPLLEPGERAGDLQVCQEARWLIGLWCNTAADGPRQTLCGWAREAWPDVPPWFWGERCRSRLARHVGRIKHWRVHCCDYADVPDHRATWFLDPPYRGSLGSHYQHSSDKLDYRNLACWCRSRPGQVIVCENVAADWLPFREFSRTSTPTRNGGRQNHEAIYHQADKV